MNADREPNGLVACGPRWQTDDPKEAKLKTLSCKHNVSLTRAVDCDHARPMRDGMSSRSQRRMDVATNEASVSGHPNREGARTGEAGQASDLARSRSAMRGNATI